MADKTKIIVWCLMHGAFVGIICAAVAVLYDLSTDLPLVLYALLLIAVYHLVGAIIGAIELAEGPDEE